LKDKSRKLIDGIPKVGDEKRFMLEEKIQERIPLEMEVENCIVI